MGACTSLATAACFAALAFATTSAHAAEASDDEPAAVTPVPSPAPAPAPSVPEPPAPPTAASPSAAPEPEAAPSASSPTVGPITGRVVTYARSPFRDAPMHQASASIWLEVAPRFGPSYAKVVVTGDAFAASVSNAPPLRARVREGYAGIQTEHFDLRVGQQILPWGNADAFNPTDLLTARDYTFFSANPEANRLGVLSTRATYSTTRFSVTGVWTPVAPLSTLLLPPTPIPAGVTLGDVRRPDPTLGNSEFAGRIAVNGNGWDASLMGFRGWNHLPEFEYRGSDQTGVLLGTTQRRATAVGGDASVGIKKYVLRVETAYVITDNPSGRHQEIQPSHWDTTAGLETSFFDERLRVQVQGIARVHPGYSPPSSISSGPDPATGAVLAAIAQVNSVLLNYTTRYRVASSGRVTYSTSDDKFSAELFAVVDLDGSGDWFVRPLTAYHATDALKFELGADLYVGPFATPLGALRSYTGAFLEATYQF